MKCRLIAVASLLFLGCSAATQEDVEPIIDSGTSDDDPPPPPPPRPTTGGSGGTAGAAGASGGSTGGLDAGAGATGAVDAAPPRPTDGPAAALDLAPPPMNAMPSAACGAGMPAPDGAQTIQNNGRDRRFIVRVPAGYDGKRPWPVLFLFHGAGGNATNYDRSSNFRRDFGDKAVLVFPEALIFAQTGATTWMRDAPDDIALFDGIVSWLKGRICIDTARFFSAGHSSGGFFSNTLGCQRGNVLRGIGPVSGGPREMKNCVNTVAAWIAHGTQDTNIRIATGIQGRDFWIQRSACSPQNPMPTSPMPCVAYQGCRAGYPLHWCAFEGGHTWPSFANKALWDFFSKL